jgi:hypothetical protein
VIDRSTLRRAVPQRHGTLIGWTEPDAPNGLADQIRHAAVRATGDLVESLKLLSAEVYLRFNHRCHFIRSTDTRQPESARLRSSSPILTLAVDFTDDVRLTTRWEPHGTTTQTKPDLVVVRPRFLDGNRHARSVCIDVMRAMAEARGISVARIATAWLLHRSFVMSVIVGAKTIEQLTTIWWPRISRREVAGLARSR